MDEKTIKRIERKIDYIAGMLGGGYLLALIALIDANSMLDEWLTKIIIVLVAFIAPVLMANQYNKIFKTKSKDD